jgi:hypothetical protein
MFWKLRKNADNSNDIERRETRDEKRGGAERWRNGEAEKR